MVGERLIPPVRGLFLIDTTAETVSKTPLRTFVGALSLNKWSTSCGTQCAAETTGKGVQSSRAEFSDITDESQLRGKSAGFLFSFWQRITPFVMLHSGDLGATTGACKQC